MKPSCANSALLPSCSARRPIPAAAASAHSELDTEVARGQPGQVRNIPHLCSGGQGGADARRLDDRSAGPKLTREDNGVWTVTAGPLRPDLYTYFFLVDGVQVLNPKNNLVKTGLSSSSESMVDIPGDESAFHALRPVPHGSLHVEWYMSKATDGMRRLHVYTPPGYDSGSSRYPVLYLLHGGGDTDAGWTEVGRANFILDNLLAEKRRSR